MTGGAEAPFGNPGTVIVPALERLGYPFEREAIARTIDYYLHRSAHDSTLSRIADAWIAGTEG